MIAMIERLIASGHAYEAEGHVLFDVPSDPDYGALARRDREAMIAGARVEVAPYKRDPADFVLWKPSAEGVIGWDSPVGPRPAGLAHRMLGDDPRASRARRSTSTAAGSTSSSRTTRMRSRRAAAPMAARRSRATGCTTASSTWAPRRCRRASATSSRSTSCWRRAIAARCCGWRCCPRIIASRCRGPRALVAQSKATLDRLYRAAGDAEPGEVDEGVLEALARRPQHAAGAVAAVGDRRSGDAQGAARSLLGPAGDASPDEWFQGEGDGGDIEARIAARAEAKKNRDFADGRPHPRRAEGRGHPAWRTGRAALHGGGNERAALHDARSCGSRRRSPSSQPLDRAGRRGRAPLADLRQPDRGSRSSSTATAASSGCRRQVEACAFGQASAALIGRHAVGRDARRGVGGARAS